jgi:uncharacterized damage-inducible protein DinB
MRKACFTVATVLAGSLLAQDSGPLTSSNKMVYGNIKNFVTRAADKMPEEHYGFQPTPEVRTFGQLIGHIADAQNRMCASALGEQPPQGSVEKTKTTKADLQAAVKESFAYCDKAFDAVTDANAAEMVPFFRGERPNLGVLSFLVAHSYEHYGNLVTYMRIKGLVPPSSER